MSELNDNKKTKKTAVEPNPFSFKNFLQVDTLSTSTAPTPSPTTSSASRLLLPGIDDDTQQTTTNQFSFKNFIKDENNFNILPPPPPPPPPPPSSTTTTTDHFILPELENENLSLNDLKNDLNIKNKVIEDQRSLITKLQQRIKVLKEKEFNDNKALEDIIQKVEENLVITTKRATESEQKVDQLKQELKTCKQKAALLATENFKLKNVDIEQEMAKEMERDQLLKDFSNQLQSSAMTAETSLKQLLTGVEQLRLLSQRIDSFGKIYTLINNENTSSTTTTTTDS
jgi:hypothetical protein